MSWAEAKWTVDSLLQKIGQAPNNMRSFIAYSLSATSIGLKFQEPADSYDANNNLICSVGGVMIRMSDTGYPTKPSEGTLVVNNTNLGAYVNTPFTVSGLTKGRKYYFPRSLIPYRAFTTCRAMRQTERTQLPPQVKSPMSPFLLTMIPRFPVW